MSACACPHCGGQIDLVVVATQHGAPVVVEAETRSVQPPPPLRPRPVRPAPPLPENREARRVHQAKASLDAAGAHRWYTLAEVAAILGVSTATVRRRSKAGTLPKVVSGRIWNPDLALERRNG